MSVTTRRVAPVQRLSSWLKRATDRWPAGAHNNLPQAHRACDDNFSDQIWSSSSVPRTLDRSTSFISNGSPLQIESSSPDPFRLGEAERRAHIRARTGHGTHMLERKKVITLIRTSPSADEALDP